jgi:hypothetical protein
MINRSVASITTAVVLVIAASSVVTAQTSEVSARLLPNGTLMIHGGPADNWVVVTTRENDPDVVYVQGDFTETWTFLASDVKALEVMTEEGDDRLTFLSELASWTLSRVQVHLGPGTGDYATFGVYSPNHDSNSLTILGDVKAQGGSFKLHAGSATGDALLTVLGDYTAFGGPGDDSLGIDAEFPAGTVIVEGDVRLKGGDGDDYAEINANGSVHVEGDFTVKGQAGEDYIWLGGLEGGDVGGTADLDGGADSDILYLDNFSSTDLIYEKFEVCIGCP